MDNQAESIKMTKATARAAPLETPSKEGSANGFLNKACVMAPAKPKPAPTARAKSALGIRISQIICDVCQSVIDKDEGPINIDNKKQRLKIKMLANILNKKILS
jgi:hypothetical protein